MNSLQQYAEIPSALVIPGNLSALFSQDHIDSEIAALFSAGLDPQESIDGLMRQFEMKHDELLRAHERFQAACRERDAVERGDTDGFLSDQPQELSHQSRSRGLLRAEASLAQLEMNTVRNQVEYLADLIRRIQKRVDSFRRRTDS